MSNYFNEFLKIATLYKNNNAVICPIYNDKKKIKEIIYSYGDIINHISSVGQVIKKINKKGGPVGLLLTNHPLFTSALLSVISVDFVLVPIDPKVTRANIAKILFDNKVRVIITDRKHFKSLKDFSFKDLTILFIEELISCPANKILKSHKRLNDVIIVSYTSGTSGVPKGALITNKNIIFVAKKYCELYHLNGDSRVLAALPLWHNYGMFAALLNTFLGGGAVIIINGWAPKKAIKAIHEYKVSVFPGSPFMYIDMVNIDSKLGDFSSLKICDSGGYSLPVEYIKKFEKKTGAVITEGYGLTETTSLTHFNCFAKNRKIGSIGKSIPEALCKIVDKNGENVKIGEYGILWVRGPMVCKGYSNFKSLNFQRNWFNTGDIVKSDSEGNYFIAGRLSDVKNIEKNKEGFLRNIEEILYKFNGLTRVYVRKNINNDDSYYLYVVLKNSKLKNNFKKFLNTKLANVTFRKVFFVKKLPITGTGKIKYSSINI